MNRLRSSSAANAAKRASTAAASKLTVPPLRFGASKLISSSSRSITVASRRAPMFSVRSLTSKAICAMRRMASSCRSSVTPSVASSAWYCLTRLAWVLFRMASKSATDKESSSTRIGSRPCSSGIRSLGLLRWKAPLAMKRMWSVFTRPYLVDTVVPSTSGSRSRCTPWRDTSAPPCSWRDATLSISSMKTMPISWACCNAAERISSSLTSLAASSSTSSFIASPILSLRVFFWPAPIWPNRPLSCSAMSSMPGWLPKGVSTSRLGLGASRSSSMSLSSSWPSRSFLRKFWRVALSGSEPGSSTSRMRSSAASSARVRQRRIAPSRSCLTATSTRSRMMESTSLPT
mmetsp:Transcript_53289/g.125095  ORF Transcript_53289/g.125095 Transcript_53289/m.125095 type:complete len:346 (-) Transcript_53289:2169-3206(-)